MLPSWVIYQTQLAFTDFAISADLLEKCVLHVSCHYFSLQAMATPKQPNLLNSTTMGGTASDKDTYSAKHNGILLYFSRIIRPLWNRSLAMSCPAEAGPPGAYQVCGCFYLRWDLYNRVRRWRWWWGSVGAGDVLNVYRLCVSLCTVYVAVCLFL